MKDPDTPLIFLDIDGVLNGHQFDKKSQSNLIDIESVGWLNRIILHTDAKIVLSSAWRYMVLGGAMTLQGFEYMLRTHGVHCVDRLIGHTCSDEEIGERGGQITHWRYANGHKGRYAVIDDMDLNISGVHPFVRTDGEVGLTFRDMRLAVGILGESDRRTA